MIAIVCFVYCSCTEIIFVKKSYFYSEMKKYSQKIINMKYSFFVFMFLIPRNLEHIHEKSCLWLRRKVVSTALEVLEFWIW